ETFKDSFFPFIGISVTISTLESIKVFNNNHLFTGGCCDIMYIYAI
ncbi:MAG: hypothetical protein ACI9GH_000541, partial [Candidatus Paceibacteria bacterium]